MVVACDTATKLTRQWSPVHRRRSLPLLLLLPTAALHLPLGEVERSLFTALPVSLVAVATGFLSTHTPGVLMPWVCRPQLRWHCGCCQRSIVAVAAPPRGQDTQAPPSSPLLCD